MKVVYFATGNEEKLREARQILKGFDVRQISIDVPELQGEPHEVASEKAKIAYKLAKKPIFIDDTGLAINALGGMPGIYIKHFLKAIGPKGLHKMTSPFSDKKATAFASIGFCDGKHTKVFLGECKGKIVKFRDAGHGFRFGFDTIFQPNGYNKTFGQLRPEIKNKISHRRKALEKLRRYLLN